MDLIGLSLLVRWLIGWRLWLGLERLPVKRSQGQPRLSVLIPARDEEGPLPHLLEALRGQSLPPEEVIVVDDHSSDRTAAVVKAAGVTVLQPPPLPEGCSSSSMPTPNRAPIFCRAWWPASSSGAAWCRCSPSIAPRSPTNCCRCSSTSWA